MSDPEPNCYILRCRGWWTVEGRCSNVKAGPFRTLHDAVEYAVKHYGSYSLI